MPENYNMEAGEAAGATRAVGVVSFPRPGGKRPYMRAIDERPNLDDAEEELANTTPRTRPSGCPRAKSIAAVLVLGGLLRTTNPRTEIIVRQRQEVPPSDYFGGLKESNLPSLSCLTDEPMGFRFMTGVGGTLPCNCRPGAYLNCDA